MFNFRCPICGSEPPKILLCDYLEEWGLSTKERLEDFLSLLNDCMSNIIKNKEFYNNAKLRIFCKESIIFISELKNKYDLKFKNIPTFSDSKDQELHFLSRCPICNYPQGPRKRGTYFNHWSKARNVQVVNLFYESNLILWGILRKLPDWADGKFLSDLNKLRIKLLESAETLNLLKCPQCHRYTTCLYGDSEDEKDQACRWCMDASGAMTFGLSVNFSFEPELDFDIEVMQHDAKLPAKQNRDILPPIHKSLNIKQEDREPIIGGYMNTEYSTFFEFLLIPKCCSKYKFGCHFSTDDFRTLLINSLYFCCPNCKKQYLTSRNLFKNSSILNINLHKMNDKLNKSKKNGFLMCVETSPSIYKFIDQLLKPHANIWQMNEFDLSHSLSVLSSFSTNEDKIDMSEYNEGFFIDNVLLYCRKCGEIFDIDDYFITQRKVVCPLCSNKQIIPKKLTKEIFKFTKSLNNSIEKANQEGILFIPYNTFWKPNWL